jgi:hypothetical protein
LNQWECLIDISTLNAGSYRVRYHFFNATSSGMAYSPIFNVIEIVINPGILIFNEEGDYLTLSNITIVDNHGTLVESLEGALYEIFTENGISTGIVGNFFFNVTTNYWETGINITNLPDGLYYAQLHFYNSTTSIHIDTAIFQIGKNSSTQLSDMSSSFTTTPSSPFSKSHTKQTERSSFSSFSSSTSESTNIEITSFPGTMFLLILLFQLVFIVKKIKRKQR